MKSNWKKLLSLALVLALMLGFAPEVGPTARATNAYSGYVNTTTTVRFNNMDWYIIADNSTAADAGTVTLLTKDPITAMPFLENGPTGWTNDDSTSYQYSTSTLKTYLDGLTDAGGSFAAVADAIVPTDLTDLTNEQVSGAKIYPPSSELVNLSSDVLKCTTVSGSHNGNWWRRTKGNYHTTAGSVDGINGKNWKDVAVGLSAGVRPALRLDLSKVVFSNNTFALPSPVASVTPSSGGTTTEYTTFSAALDAWTDGSKLTLLSDVTTDSTISVSGTKTLDLNGHGIKYTGGAGQTSSVITVGNGANLTLKDSGSTTHYYTVDGDGLATVNDSGAQTYSFTGGYITGANTYGIGEGYGAVHVVSGGTFTMYGGTIIGNRAERGGGVQNNGNFTLNDGTITGNISHVHGGGVCTRGGNSRTIIAGGTITKNVARRFGGGLNISGPTEMSGGTISDNEIKPRDEQGQTGGGGGVYVDNSFTLTGGTISGNKAVNNTDKNNQLGGGGILIGNGQLTLSGNTVIKNNSGINGYDDLYVPTGKTIAIGGELSGESIGVTMQTPGVFTGSTDTSYNDASKFVSDNASYAVGKNADGQLFLSAPVTVTFDTNGRGTAPDSLTVPGGSVITSPAAPTETGYTFGGWYTEAECLNAFDFTAAVTADTTLYAKWALNTYTVAFDANGGTGIMAKQTASYNVAAELTANAFTRADCTFAGWNTEADGTGTPYADGASVALTGDLTLYAQWTSKPLYTVSGMVKQGGAAVSGVTLQLVQGEKKIAVTATNDDGAFSFSAPDGIYNIVAVKDGKTKTELVTLNAAQTADIVLPTENVNSTLTVTGSEIKNVMVGGLDELAEANSEAGQTVTVTMTVMESTGAANASDIQTVAAANQTLDCLEIKIKKTVDSGAEEDVTDTGSNVLEIVVPYRFTGKRNVEVYRYHGSAEKLKKEDSKADGTYQTDENNGLIYIYASKFSTYAIGYTQLYTVACPINYGSYTGTVTVSLLDASDNVVASHAIDVNNGSGTYSFTGVPEGEYKLRAVWTEGEKETTLNGTLRVQ